MKAHNSQQNPTRFKPKPLSIEQENAIDLLLMGKSDREVAEVVGVSRWAVQGWRTAHPLFAATLAQRREEVFGAAVNRLRSLLCRALENIAGAIDGGDVKASFELVKATGVYGFCPPTGETDVQKIADELVMRQLAQEHIPGTYNDLLIKLDENPRRAKRQQEIEAALMAEFGEGEA
jgi:hypothetical protein